MSGFTSGVARISCSAMWMVSPLLSEGVNLDVANDVTESFTVFVKEVEPRLRHALVAVYGQEQGRDATAEALAYAWEE